MTNEKANNIARGITDKIEATTDIDDWAEFWGFTRDDYEEFLDVAIEALSAEPCEDCISRKAVLDALNKWDWQELYLPVHFKDIIDDLPSIQPKPKTGHWISKHIVDDCNGVVLWYECSECGRSVDAPITEEFMLKDYPYCHCGAKMLPTDSEKE